MTRPAAERYRVEIPALVQRAIGLAEELGFPVMPEGRPPGYDGPPSACVPELGRLLLADSPPFDLLFMDAEAFRLLEPGDWDAVIEQVLVGGIIVFDDLKPVDQWPPEWRDQVDRKREFALHNPRVIGAEVRTQDSEAALIVTRVR